MVKYQATLSIQFTNQIKEKRIKRYSHDKITNYLAIKL